MALFGLLRFQLQPEAAGARPWLTDEADTKADFWQGRSPCFFGIVELVLAVHIVFPMRAALRLLVCLLTSASIAVAIVPAQAVVPQGGRAGCCAKMKMDGQAKDCGHHAPKSDQEKQCCAACLPCVAIIPSAPRPFVYPPTGEQSFAALAIREHVRSHRPPVPPPRA